MSSSSLTGSQGLSWPVQTSIEQKENEVEFEEREPSQKRRLDKGAEKSGSSLTTDNAAFAAPGADHSNRLKHYEIVKVSFSICLGPDVGARERCPESMEALTMDKRPVAFLLWLARPGVPRPRSARR